MTGGSLPPEDAEGRLDGTLSLPPGPPWDLPIDEAPFAFLDLEMTGLKVGEDRVIEVCIERVRGGHLEDRLHSLVDPQGREGNEHVHGLSPQALVGAPTFAQIAERVVELLDGAVPVAHGAKWDLSFLADELGRVGLGSRAPQHAIDTVVLARRAFHQHQHGLSALAKALGIPVERAHRADADVATLRGLWQHLAAAISARTPRDLWEVRVGEPSTRTLIREQLEQAKAEGRPVLLVYRPSRKAAQTLRYVPTALVPPNVLGYVLPGRGRRILRIERILRVDPEPTGRAPEEP